MPSTVVRAVLQRARVGDLLGRHHRLVEQLDTVRALLVDAERDRVADRQDPAGIAVGGAGVVAARSAAPCRRRCRRSPPAPPPAPPRPALPPPVPPPRRRRPAAAPRIRRRCRRIPTRPRHPSSPRCRLVPPPPVVPAVPLGAAPFRWCPRRPWCLPCRAGRSRGAGGAAGTRRSRDAGRAAGARRSRRARAAAVPAVPVSSAGTSGAQPSSKVNASAAPARTRAWSRAGGHPPGMGTTREIPSVARAPSSVAAREGQKAARPGIRCW